MYPVCVCQCMTMYECARQLKWEPWQHILCKGRSFPKWKSIESGQWCSKPHRSGCLVVGATAGKQMGKDECGLQPTADQPDIFGLPPCFSPQRLTDGYFMKTCNPTGKSENCVTLAPNKPMPWAVSQPNAWFSSANPTTGSSRSPFSQSQSQLVFDCVKTSVTGAGIRRRFFCGLNFAKILTGSIPRLARERLCGRAALG